MDSRGSAFTPMAPGESKSLNLRLGTESCAPANDTGRTKAAAPARVARCKKSRREYKVDISYGLFWVKVNHKRRVRALEVERRHSCRPGSSPRPNRTRTSPLLP